MSVPSTVRSTASSTVQQQPCTLGCVRCCVALIVLHNILLLPTAVRSLPLFPVSAPACSLGHLHSRMYVQHKCTAPAYHLYPLYCCLIIYSLFQNYKRTGQGYAKLVQITSFYFPFSLTHTRAHAHRSKTLFMSHHGLHHLVTSLTTPLTSLTPGSRHKMITGCRSSLMVFATVKR